jgi:hypothetical protein
MKLQYILILTRGFAVPFKVLFCFSTWLLMSLGQFVGVEDKLDYGLPQLTKPTAQAYRFEESPYMNLPRMPGGLACSLGQRIVMSYVDDLYDYGDHPAANLLSTREAADQATALIKRYSIPSFKEAFLSGKRKLCYSDSRSALAAGLGLIEAYRDDGIKEARDEAISLFNELYQTTASTVWEKRDLLYADLARASLQADPRALLGQVADKGSGVDRQISFVAQADIVRIDRFLGKPETKDDLAKLVNQFADFQEYTTYRQLVGKESLPTDTFPFVDVQANPRQMKFTGPSRTELSRFMENGQAEKNNPEARGVRSLFSLLFSEGGWQRYNISGTPGGKGKGIGKGLKHPNSKIPIQIGNS